MTVTISVVITCYREGELLLDAIASIRQQTHPPADIILVNDASPDEATNHICHQLEPEPDITVIWQTVNGGPSVARNAGFSAASGTLLVPLDGDDQLPQGALAAIHHCFEHSPEVGFVYGAYIRQDQPDVEGQLISATADLRLSRQLAAKPWSLSTHWQLLGTTPLRKSVWAAVGGYDPDFGVQDLHDVEFWIRVLASDCGYATVEQPIYIWRKYLGANSSQVTPHAWYRLAQKYFEIYQRVGLTHRAYELLLLGSKWSNRSEEVRQYSRLLWGLLLKGQVPKGQIPVSTMFSTVVSLMMPAALVRWLATRVQRHR